MVVRNIAPTMPPSGAAYVCDFRNTPTRTIMVAKEQYLERLLATTHGLWRAVVEQAERNMHEPARWVVAAKRGSFIERWGPQARAATAVGVLATRLVYVSPSKHYPLHHISNSL